VSYEVNVVVNGTAHRLDVEPRLLLADLLRERLGLVGTHLGCEHGVCGVCSVILDGQVVRSCLTLAVQADGSEITTVEGIGDRSAPHPLQLAFAEHHALQCGFCTPGFLVTAAHALASEPALSAAEVKEELDGVLCRCTGYANILAAVLAVRDARLAQGNGTPSGGGES
jgi:carbon-monoxide dehydrogenase small subunit